jgi:mannose-6-phosphate isomerase-like protein (cupin superfamily)
MSGFYTHLEEETLKNDFFRKVLFTAPQSQLVLMALQPREDIGSEVHQENDQFFRFEGGEGKVMIGDEEHVVGDGDSVVIPAGTEHNVINTSETEMLKMYTIYSPSHHPDGTIHKTKAEAMAAEAAEDH